MLLYAGVRKETATQILKVLGFTKEINSKHHDIQDILFKNNTNSSESMFYRVKAIFLQNGANVEYQIKNLTIQHYQTKIEMMDFDKNPKGSVEKINKWVATHSNDQMKDLIFKDVTIYTNFLLVSAIEFQAKWNHLIFPKDTTLKAFNGIAGPTKPIPMMTFNGTIMYFIDPLGKVQVMELPYLVDNIGAYIILPSSESNITNVESKLTTMGVRSILTRLIPTNVKVILPKLAFKLNYDLAPQLREMGMPFMFDKRKGNVTLAEIVTSFMLPLNNFYHQSTTSFQDDGKLLGQEMAVPSGLSNISPQIFKADRPFLFCIVSKNTQIPIFIGRYMGE
ncbi:unnamed protein product [Gordionus sp. m RMFG-2023]